MWPALDEDEITPHTYSPLETLALVGTSAFPHCCCVLCPIYCNKKDLTHTVLSEYAEEKCILNLLFILIYKNTVHFIIESLTVKKFNLLVLGPKIPRYYVATKYFIFIAQFERLITLLSF